MTARVLCFVALDDPTPVAAAARAACAAAHPHARPLPLAPSEAPPAIRELADRLAEYLHLRPIAHELATLAVLVALLRDEGAAPVVAHAATPEQLLRLAAAADLARDRLTHERPPAGSSTLAAQRAASGGAEFPILASAAAGGDVLRAPELTRIALVGRSCAAAEHAEMQLGISSVPVAVHVTSSDPATISAALDAAAVARDLTPRAALQPGAAPALHVPLPGVPDDLRAVRSGETLALHGAGASRRHAAPAVLGPHRPGAVRAGEQQLDVTLTPVRSQ